MAKRKQTMTDVEAIERVRNLGPEYVIVADLATLGRIMRDIVVERGLAKAPAQRKSRAKPKPETPAGGAS